MTAARAFGMKRVNGSAIYCRDRVLDKARFIQCVRVDHGLHIELISDRQAAVDGGRRGSPIFMKFHRTRASQNLFFECTRE